MFIDIQLLSSLPLSQSFLYRGVWNPWYFNSHIIAGIQCSTFYQKEGLLIGEFLSCLSLYGGRLCFGVWHTLHFKAFSHSAIVFTSRTPVLYAS